MSWKRASYGGSRYRRKRGRRGEGSDSTFRQSSPEASTVDPAKVEAIARSAAESVGLDVLAARVSGSGHLRLIVENATAPLTVSDCAAASRAVADSLRAAGIDPGSLAIEVESPGIDRPLLRPADFERFRGCQVTVSLRESRNGRRNFTGPLIARDAASGDVTVQVLDEAEPETFRGTEIREVRLRPPFKERPAE